MRLLRLISLLVSAASIVAGCGGKVSGNIGGKVSGLASGNKVELALAVNGANVEKLSVAYNSTDNSFTFNQAVDTGETYNVTVSTQPTGQVCSPDAKGSGKIADGGGDVDDIQITCVTGSASTVPLTANVAGLAQGAQIVLQDIVAGTLTITGTAETAAGKTISGFFPFGLTIGQLYSVIIKTPPTFGPPCFTDNSRTGTITGSATGTPSNPSPVAIVCQ